MKYLISVLCFLLISGMAGCNYSKKEAVVSSAKKPPVIETFDLKVLGLKNEEGLIVLYGLRDGQKIRIILGTKGTVPQKTAFLKGSIGQIILATVTTATVNNELVYSVTGSGIQPK